MHALLINGTSARKLLSRGRYTLKVQCMILIQHRPGGSDLQPRFINMAALQPAETDPFDDARGLLPPGQILEVSRCRCGIADKPTSIQNAAINPGVFCRGLSGQSSCSLFFLLFSQCPEGDRSRRRTTPNTRLNATQSQPHCPPAPPSCSQESADLKCHDSLGTKPILGHVLSSIMPRFLQVQVISGGLSA